MMGDMKSVRIFDHTLRYLRGCPVELQSSGTGTIATQTSLMSPHTHPVCVLADLMCSRRFPVRCPDQAEGVPIWVLLVHAYYQAFGVVLDLLTWFAKVRNVLIGPDRPRRTTSRRRLVRRELEAY